MGGLRSRYDWSLPRVEGSEKMDKILEGNIKKERRSKRWKEFGKGEEGRFTPYWSDRLWNEEEYKEGNCYKEGS